MIQILPLRGMGEIEPGSDLAGALLAGLDTSGLALQPGDILVVTQKIVSKAEGRFVELSAVTPGARALELAETTRKDPRLVELVLSESSDVVRAVPGVLITRHRHGLVMANAGIDRSNIGPAGGERVLLLPEDPDGSARALAGAMERRTAVRPAVVISDSFGRPWRHGVVCVAIGVTGLPSLLDRRGDVDRDGRTLEVTQIAVGDMVATAAGMATGEGAEGIPAVLVRGYAVPGEERPATDLVRPLTEDLFR
ncbi:MAG: coenzyme F420-0:L-glutamate ligase [Sphingobium sp.]